MQTLTVLSDAELDAVSGGNNRGGINIPIIRSFGSGGSGGTIVVGAGGNVSANGAFNVSVSNSSFSANGGNGTFTVS